MPTAESVTVEGRPGGSLFTIIVLSLSALVSIPFLTLGYGADGDAWRVARAAWRLWTTGRYEVSRFPGYPLHEILMAPFVGLGGAPFANAATLAVALLAILLWRSIILRRTRFPRLLLLTFAFMPIIVVNASSTMDYLWSLTCILIAIRSAQSGKDILSGVFIGCAAGFRLPNIVAVFPVAILLFADRRSPATVIRFLSTAALCSVLAFMPVIGTYGIQGWRDAMQMQLTGVSIPLMDHFILGIYRAIFAIGLIPAVVVGVILFRGRLARPSDSISIMGGTGVLTFALLFFLFPFQREYLIPIIPFLLLVLDRIANERWMQIFFASVLSFAFINFDVVYHHGMRGEPGFTIRPGLLIEEWQNRTVLLKDRKALPQLFFPRRTVVMTGWEDCFSFQNDAVVADSSLPWLGFQEPVFHSRANPTLHFVSLLYSNEVTDLQNAGCTLYYRPGTREYIESVVGYDPADRNIPSLPR